MRELLEQLRNPWVIVGFAAQALFFARFLVQWIASEQEGRSVIPLAFWQLSVLGAGGLLVYAVQIRNPVFIIGQSCGLLIYVRNLRLIRRERLAAAALAGPEDREGPSLPRIPPTGTTDRVGAERR